MIRGNTLFVSVSALVLGLSAASYNVAIAQSASEQKAIEDIAFKSALQINTVEAIEEFLNQYPRGSGGSVCRVLALAEEGPEGGNDGGSAGGPGDSGGSANDGGSAGGTGDGGGSGANDGGSVE
ncbi:MAG: hypothetical protein GY789_22255 [Hyphomicrobiales bacterium]|nr:hypothetical protein [Hyphomicrobiales bacterium]MCP5000177.1 hypothetical protein [Hyphomicrobiales bacterium]